MKSLALIVVASAVISCQSAPPTETQTTPKAGGVAASHKSKTPHGGVADTQADPAPPGVQTGIPK